MRRTASATALLTAVALAGCAQQAPTPASTTSTTASTPTETPTSHAEPPAAPAGIQTPNPPPNAAAGPTGTLTIPKLGVNASIIGRCETTPQGLIEGPPDVNTTCAVGREDFTPLGEGATIIGSHTFRDARVGALEHINQLTPGDTLTTGNTTWRIQAGGTYPATKLPPQLFTTDGPRRLILITCHLTPAIEAGAPYTDTDLEVATPVS